MAGNCGGFECLYEVIILKKRKYFGILQIYTKKMGI